MLNQKIGKFEIFSLFNYCLANYKYKDLTDEEKKIYAVSVAILGARAKTYQSSSGPKKFGFTPKKELKTLQKAAASKKKVGFVDVRAWDRVESKFGSKFKTSKSLISKLVENKVSYDEIKSVVKISNAWGAKITTTDFVNRLERHLGELK